MLTPAPNRQNITPEQIQETLKEVLSGYFSENRYHRDGDKEWHTAEDKIEITVPDGSDQFEVSICYPDRYQDSTEATPAILYILKSELEAHSIEVASFNAHSYKDYSWYCHSGRISFVLENNEASLQLLKEISLEKPPGFLSLLRAEREQLESLDKLFDGAQLPDSEDVRSLVAEIKQKAIQDLSASFRHLHEAVESV
jgi:hypothetical protein